MAYSLKLKIPELPKSLNSALRTNRHAYTRYMNYWAKIIEEETRGKLPEKPLEKCELRFIRHFYKTLDFDGVTASMKPISDSLIRAGIILDDRWNVTGPWHIDQIFRPKNKGPMLEIDVKEIGARNWAKETL